MTELTNFDRRNSRDRMTHRTKAAGNPLSLLSIMLASIARFLTGGEQAYLCSVICHELWALDDNDLAKGGLTRSEIPRRAATAAGMLPLRDWDTDTGPKSAKPKDGVFSRMAA